MLNLIPGSLNVFNTNVGLKTNFIEKYGNIASKYDHLDPLGNQKFDTTWPMIVGIVSLFATVASFIASKPKLLTKNTNIENPNLVKNEKTPMQKILQYVWWVLLCVTIIFFILAAIKYFKDYKPQYNSWFKELPNEAKASLNIISTIDAIQNTASNTSFKRSY